MRFPNAYKGIRRLFAAEIFQLINTVILLFFGIMTTLLADTPSTTISMFLGMLLLATLFSTFIIPVFAIIIELSGLKKAGKDEEMFKRAHFVAVFQVLTILAAGLLSFTGLDGTTIADATGSVSWVVRAFTVWFVCNGIDSLMRKSGKTALVKRGRFVRILMIAAITISFWSDLLPSFFKDGSLNGFDDFISVASSALRLVAEIMYLNHLRKVKNDLKNETE